MFYMTCVDRNLGDQVNNSSYEFSPLHVSTLTVVCQPVLLTQKCGWQRRQDSVK